MTAPLLALAVGLAIGVTVVAWLHAGTGDEHWWPRELDRLDRDCDRLAGLYLQEVGR